MKMKKTIAILMILMLLLAAGCRKKAYRASEPQAATAAPAAEAAVTMAPPAVPTVTEAPAQVSAEPIQYAFSFSAQTLDGATMTEAFFGQHDLTMVNVWASWCPPCRGELGELGQLYQKLPANVGFLSVTIDDPGDLADAKTLLQQNGCAFPCLDITSSQELSDEILPQVMAIPATLFFDRSGNLVGNMVIGAPERNGSVVEGYLYEIQNRLAQVNGK